MLTRLRSVVSRVASIYRRREFERRLRDEWRLHLDLLTAENVQRGMPQREARRQAIITLGGFEQAREECREMNCFRWLSELSGDLLLAFRSLRQNAVFTATVVIVLGLGIGANNGVLTLIDAVVFRPLPAARPDQLVEIPSGVSLPDYKDIRAADDALSGLAAYSGLPLFARTASEGLSGRSVTANFFQVLGLRMAAGRGFLPEEAEFPSGHPVAVISYRLWQRSYGSDPGVIGRTLQLNGETVAIVGVAPKGFRDIVLAGPYQDLWLPLPQYARVMHIEQSPDWQAAREDRSLRWLGVVGRLRSGIRLNQAQPRLGVVFDNLKKDYPSLHEDWNPTLVSADRIRWPGGNRLFASTVMISSGLCLLLIACTNVAGLLLARGSARQKEIATRLALGASRSRIVRQLLTEGLALSSLGLITGIAVCAVTLKSLPQLQGTLGTPLDLGLSIDLRSLAIASAIALFSTLLFALTPALLASRVELTGALKDQGFLNTRPRKSRGRRILVSLQVFLSFVLLLAAALFARTILHFEFVDPGFDRSVLLVKSDFLSVGFDRSQGIDFYNRSLYRIRELPGVRAASWAEDLPFTQPYGLWERIRPVPTGKNSEAWTSTDCNSITGDYFRTLGIPILQGRDITEQDFRRLAAVVVVNETLAHRYWPPGQAIGKRIQVKGFNPEVCEVVGVVKDAKYRTLWESGKPYAYFPFWLHLYFHMDLHVSAYGDPALLVAPIRKACAAVNPGVTLDSPRLISTQIESLLAEERSAAFMLMTLGGLALAMAAAGLYGIVSYSASRRMRELGIRVALGARSWDILKQVMSEGLALAHSGVAAGLLCSLILGRFLASRLHGLSPLDPITYCTISLLCVSVAALAVFIPARKVTKDPTHALRCE